MIDHSPENLARRSKRLKIDPLQGLMQQCYRCEEWWPATTEFYNRAPKRPIGVGAPCRACKAEMR